MRFPGATHLVITVSGRHTKRGWAERALQRLREQIAPLGVELNLEKTRMVNTLKGEAFGFLGFDLRRVRKQSGDGYFMLIAALGDLRSGSVTFEPCCCMWVAGGR